MISETMISETGKPTIAVTIGDPAGIGPEVVLKALSAPEIKCLASWVVVGDRVALEKAAASCRISSIAPDADVRDLSIFQAPAQFAFGELNATCGRAALEYVKCAAQMCLSGEAHAMVTAPLNKEAVTLSGTPFSGHTEYIAELCGATDSRMLLASQRLSVVHVTTHIALREALNSSTERILRTIELGHEAMKLLGVERPRIAMCGLNPHAAEHGLFGDEEAERITPAIAAASQKGINIDGPHAPDTIFLLASRGAYDLVVAMYHDQGHIAMKLIDFEQTVNVTLGIPIIRTSVDHGTAFDIAGKNKADPQNMISAMKMGAAMAARQMRRERSDKTLLRAD
jgi:4-phospho-D-threonate 3-dehydrogenase / 4-phospho-D-erythronate 3-dehydrogenase